MLNTIFASLSEGIAPSTTAYESIATVTVGSGGSASISFTSIPATYTHLQVRCLAKATSAVLVATNVFAAFNGDTGANYTYHYLRGNGSSVDAIAGTAQTGSLINDATVGSNAGQANMFGSYIIDILDYTNTNKYKTVRILSGADVNSTGTTQLGLGSSLWLNTAAITQIVLTPASSNFAQYSSFALYGIKGA